MDHEDGLVSSTFRVEKRFLLEGAASARGLTVIIDVFRAFTTACYLMEAAPGDYFLVGDSATAARLAATVPAPFLVGKPELGAALRYDIPSSPTRALGQPVAGRTIIHRTGAGARGILRAVAATELIAASLVNLDALVRYLRARARPGEVITLVCMGHEGETRSDEDELCADAIAAGLRGEPFDLAPRARDLREGPGRYFFTDAQDEYPSEDFARCTAPSRHDFILRAERRGDHARLVRVDA